MTVTLRGYQPSDLDALHELDVVCFEAAFRFSRSAMRRFAEARNARVVVAEVSGVLAGFCILHVERLGAGRVGYVVTLDVDPAHRRQRIAQALMAEAEEQARAAGCAEIVLHVFSENSAAIEFYRALGFVLAGVETGFYGRGLDAQVWRKAIVGSGTLAS